MKKISLVFALMLIFACSSNDDSSVDCNDLSTQGIPIIEAFLNTGIAYANDQSVTNCNAYKVALEDYITYNISLKDCVSGTDLVALKAEIAELENGLADLNCI
ncbi:MAG: hypothetical protein JXQ93_05025 [Flavobacteriaceae bacterium]